MSAQILKCTVPLLRGKPCAAHTAGCGKDPLLYVTGQSSLHTTLICMTVDRFLATSTAFNSVAGL